MVTGVQDNATLRWCRFQPLDMRQPRQLSQRRQCQVLDASQTALQPTALELRAANTEQRLLPGASRCGNMPSTCQICWSILSSQTMHFVNVSTSMRQLLHLCVERGLTCNGPQHLFDCLRCHDKHLAQNFLEASGPLRLNHESFHSLAEARTHVRNRQNQAFVSGMFNFRYPGSSNVLLASWISTIIVD